MSERKNRTRLELVEGYRFMVEFTDEAQTELFMDEPPPMGEGEGPNASRLLAAAIGNCLSASLLFCLRKSKQEVTGVETEVEATVERNEEGHWRVTRLEVAIRPEISDPDSRRVERCIDIFEKYCIVTGSVRKAIDVDVNVVPR